MPKIVDQRARRAEVAEAATRLIARDSFSGMTMRAIAKEAGISYGSLFHYFESKDAVLVHAVKHTIDQQVEQLKGALSDEQRSPLKLLRQMLVDDTVVDARSLGSHAAWATFLTQSIHNQALAKEHEAIHEAWLSTLESLLARAVERGELRAELDPELEAVTLWTLCSGISQRALIRPKALPPRRQREVIASYLEKLREPVRGHELGPATARRK